MFAAQPLDAPTADNALGVGAENDLKQHPRRIATSAALVIAVIGVEAGKVEFVVKQVMHSMFKTTRQQPLL